MRYVFTLLLPITSPLASQGVAIIKQSKHAQRNTIISLSSELVSKELSPDNEYDKC